MTTFNTWADAEKIFDKEMGCLSDDVEKEEARLERWIEDNNHEVLE